MEASATTTKPKMLYCLVAFRTEDPINAGKMADAFTIGNLLRLYHFEGVVVDDVHLCLLKLDYLNPQKTLRCLRSYEGVEVVKWNYEAMKEDSINGCEIYALSCIRSSKSMAVMKLIEKGKAGDIDNFFSWYYTKNCKRKASSDICELSSARVFYNELPAMHERDTMFCDYLNKMSEHIKILNKTVEYMKKRDRYFDLFVERMEKELGDVKAKLDEKERQLMHKDVSYFEMLRQKDVQLQLLSDSFVKYNEEMRKQNEDAFSRLNEEKNTHFTQVLKQKEEEVERCKLQNEILSVLWQQATPTID